MQRLTPDFFRRDATVVAPDLLGKVLVVGEHHASITEVEAYTQDDPASHSFRGPTPRTGVMFGPPGRWYVYVIYGLHHCLNVVTGEVGDGQAVLIRSVRCAGSAVGRTDGPGRLTAALGIDMSWNGLAAEILDPGLAVPSFVVTPRIGITKAADWPRRWLATS